MSLMHTEVYEALIDAGASEEKAKAAATSIPVGDQLASKNDLDNVKADIVEMKADIVEMKADIVGMKADIVGMKADIVAVKADVVAVKDQIARVEVSVANEFKTLYRNLWLMAASIVTLILTLGKLIF